jgi:hypothetical protein
MKVQLTVSRAGARAAHSAGEIIEVGEDEGRRMIAASQAVSVATKETAIKKSSTQKAVKE